MPVHDLGVDDDGRRTRLGQIVKARRLALNAMTQADAARTAGISDSTWLAVEKGEKASDRTLAGVDRALGWEQGSCKTILEGGDPTEATQAAVRPPHFSLADEVADLRQRLERLERELMQREPNNH